MGRSPRRLRCRPVVDRPGTEPSRGGVLLDLCTGAAARPGTLRWTLRGSGARDRNRAVAWKLNGALAVLEHGGTFTDYFAFAELLPPTELGIVAVAEETGTLTESLNRLVVRMEEEAETRLKNSVKSLGYMIYLAAAAIVSYTVISFYSGYFNIT